MDQITTLQQLRDYFADQPKETWCTFRVHNKLGQHCVLGHLVKDGVNLDLFPDGLFGGLKDMGVEPSTLVMVNNGESMENPEKDPQAAILKYLDSLINAT